LLPFKPGFISIDLDSLPEYQKFYGYQVEKSEICAIFRVSFPRILSFFEDSGIKATLFVITEHLRFPEVKEFLSHLVSEGHELASHTHTHPYPFRNLDLPILRGELEHSKKVLEDTFGVAVTGFRAPGYDITSEMIDCLEELEYRYDSSIFPTLFAPLISLAARVKSGGKTANPLHPMHMLAPLSSYFPSQRFPALRQKAARGIVEIPITVLPYVRYPFYPTWLNATGMFGLSSMFPLARRAPLFNFEMHTIDFIQWTDVDRLPQLARHPGLRLSTEVKLAHYRRIAEELGQTFRWGTLGSMAARVEGHSSQMPRV